MKKKFITILLFTTLQNEIKTADEFYLAVTNNDLESCKKLIQERAYINQENADQWRPLHASIYSGNKEITLLILSNSIFVTIKRFNKTLTLREICLDSIIKNYEKYKLEEEKKKETIKELKKFFLKDFFSLALKKMQALLKQETKQRGDCLKIAFDENHLPLLRSLNHIYQAKNLDDISDNAFVNETKKNINQMLKQKKIETS